MTVVLKALLPKVEINDNVGKVRRLLSEWAGDTWRIVAKYPSQRASVTYGRTGFYGSHWKVRPIDDGMELTNDMPYATYVGGPRQTALMATYDWPNVEKVGEEQMRGKRREIERLMGTTVEITSYEA